MEAVKLDYENWPRKEIYDFFSNISNPFYMVTFSYDVTRLYDYVKRNGLSFYYGMIWLCNRALNDIEDFRITVRDDELVILPLRKPSFTDLKKGQEQFYIVTMDHMDDIDGFCKEAARISENQNYFIDMGKEIDDLVFYSCLPWIDLTALTNERDLDDPHAKDDNTTHISWGKYNDDDGKKTLGLSVEVNHRFIDGIHIGKLVERMDHYQEML